MGNGKNPSLINHHPSLGTHQPSIIAHHYPFDQHILCHRDLNPRNARRRISGMVRRGAATQDGDISLPGFSYFRLLEV